MECSWARKKIPGEQGRECNQQAAENNSPSLSPIEAHTRYAFEAAEMQAAMMPRNRRSPGTPSSVNTWR